MKKATLRNFHVPLSEELYKMLREEANRSRQPATTLARHAIDDWLKQKRRGALHEAITQYAARHAGTSVDLDEELEAASLEYLRDQEENPQ